MKKWIIILLCFVSLSALAQETISFEKYFVTDQGSQLIQSFGPTVDLDLPETKSSFDKSQAKVIMNDFFKKNPPSNYKANHRGGGNGRANYEIGNLTSGELNFRTYLLYKLKEEMVQIIELRIELED